MPASPFSPVIPPHPSERRPSPIEPPVIPTLSPNGHVQPPPAWMGHPQAAANPAAFPTSGFGPAPGSYFAPPVALPQMATPVVQVGPTGVSTDWTGFPHFAANGQIIGYHNYPQYIPIAPGQGGGHTPAAQHAPTPAQPAHQPMMQMGPPPQMPASYFGAAATPWNAPMPGAFATPFAHPMAMGGMAWGQTPFHPAMGLAAAGAPPGFAPPVAQPPPPAAAQRAYRSSEGADRCDKWAEEPRYGPVLEAFQAKVVRAQIEPNPLLSPPPDDLTDRAYLKWNMLWPTGQCQRSSDPGVRSWSEGRNSPATWPRLRTMHLISRTFPWTITIEASDPEEGVTCGDVMEEIHVFMYGRVSKAQMDSAPTSQKNMISQSYWHNRSTAPGVPGGRLARTLLKCDWLGVNTSFGGIVEAEERTLRDISGGIALPGTFELLCVQRYPMTEDELREQEERERELQRDERRRRSRANSRASTRPSSRAPSRRASVHTDSSGSSDT